MKTEIFTLCDFAAEYSGKFNVVGAFESLYVKEAPAVLPQCYLALRLRCDKKDAGKHNIKASIVDASGKSLCTLAEAPVEIVVPEYSPSVTVQIAVGINSLKISTIGIYAIQLHVDSRLISELPLHVYQVKQNKA